MRLTPLDIREQQFRRVMRGLDPEEVEAFLASVAGEFETLVASNNELRQRVLDLEEKITEYRSMEKALRDALLAAERVMGEAKESAQREAGLIVREAEMSAQRARSRLSQELVALQHELGEMRRLKDAYVTRVRWLLRSHLELVEGHAQEFAEIDTTLAPMRPPAGRAELDGTTPPASRHEWVEPPPAPPPPVPPAWTAPPAAPPRVAPPEPATAEPQVEAWRVPPNTTPFATPRRDDLDDVLRPVGPNGTYDTYEKASGAYPPAGHPATAEEIAQAARRAERLAAEARAALERHGAHPAGSGADVDDGWNLDRLDEGPGERS